MSKQQKPQRGAPEHRPEAAEQASPELDPEIADQGFMGNAALLGRLDPGTGGVDRLEPATFDEVRDAARPLLVNGVYALQTLADPDARIARRVAVLERSALDRRHELIERLRTQEASASEVRDAMIEHFGVDDEALRSELIALVDSMLDALDVASFDDGVLHLDDADVPLADVGQAAPGRVEQLVEVLGRHKATPELEEKVADPGRAVRSFCLAIFLALHMDEEEEEEEAEIAVPEEG